MYDAFIAYRIVSDHAVAAALQAVLQKLGKPWVRRRALRVFRDDTNIIVTPRLRDAIQDALSKSRNLALMASTESAASPWVGIEVEYWLAHKGVDTILLALTAAGLIVLPIGVCARLSAPAHGAR
jgi:hypothetical protein